MAILDSKKLLPSSKEGMLAKIPSRPSFTPKYSLVPIGDLKPETDSKPSEKKVTLLNQVIEVKKKTISIEKIVNKNTKIYQKSEENKRKLLERQKREKREEGLEAKKTGDKKEEKGLSVPGLGFLDRVKKFLLFTALGGLLGIVKEYIPKILDALKIAGPIFDFIEKTAIFLADGFATFIQKSYELNDAIRTEIESFGGDEALKKFDSFTDAFKKYANLAIMLFAAGVPGSIPLKGGKLGGKLPGGKLPGGKPKLTPTTPKKPLSKFQLEQARKKAPAVKGPGIGPKSGAPRGGVFRRGPSRTLTRIQTKLIGRKNQLGLSRAARSFGNKANFVGNRLTLGGRVPVIGPLLMGYDTYMQDADGDGEPDKNINKALFVAGGSALGGLAGSFIPIPVLGSMLGTLFGGYVGDLMYEMILGKGPAAAGEKLKKDVTNALKASLDFGKHILDSIGRFFEYLPKKEIWGFKTPIPDMVKIFSSGFDLVGAFKAALFPNTFTFAAGKVTKKDEKDEKGGSYEEFNSNKKYSTGDIVRKNGKLMRFDGFGWDDYKFSTETTGSFGPVLDLIAKYESTNGSYESMYPGTILPGATTMTIAEVADKATGAVGKWQNMPKFLVDRAIAVGLDPDKDLYNAENQLKIAEYLIGPGQANVTPQLMRHKPDAAMLKLSRVWAAIPVPYDTQGDKRFVKKGESYYAGVGDNKAHITPEQMYSAMGATPAYSEGGKTKGGAHYILVGEKGPEFVLDADTTAGLEDNYPGFLDRINKADYKGSLEVLRNYASYDKKSSTIFVQRVIIKETIPVSSNSSPYF